VLVQNLAHSIAFVVALQGQPAAASEPLPPPPVLCARTAGRVELDGRLDDAPWQQAPASDAFIARDPIEGATPSQRTEVRVLYDDGAIYVGAKMYDTAPDSILAVLARRDVSVSTDRFGVYIDPYRDKRSGYYFVVSAAGTMLDGTLSNDGYEDGSWDGVWESKVTRNLDGWTCEMRVPFSQLRYARSEPVVWGINFRRVIARTNEQLFLAYQPKNGSGFVSRFPELQGLASLKPSRSLQFLPYVSSKGTYAPASAGDPFFDGSQVEGDFGADLRTNVGSRLTLNATINPDFGQVEVDPAVVNLSDVETFYPEKRPFFVEGSSNFRFGNEGASDYWNFNWPEPMFVYSRRIGRAPQLDEESYDYSDSPSGTTILGAAKLTGKITPTTNMGAMFALTAEENARYAYGTEQWQTVVEPTSGYGAARFLKEFKDRRQGVGLLGTYVRRDTRDPWVQSQLAHEAAVTGLDGWTFLDRKKVWVVSGWAAMSHLHGSKEAISLAQTNSRHYFQRPDAAQVSYDPERTTLTGFGSRLWLNKQEGRTIFNSGVGFVDPSFDVNDLGFSRYGDVANAHLGGGYKWTTPGRWKRYQNLLISFFGSTDMNGVITNAGVWGGGYTEFNNNYEFEYRAAYNPRTTNGRRTRGGPKTINLPGYELNTWFETDDRKPVSFYLSGYTYVQEQGSYDANLNPGVELRPLPSFQWRIGPTFAKSRDVAQYVTTVEDPTATHTYGSRYVFGDLTQTTFGAETQLSWAFNPKMSLQVYAQPLVVSADYSDLKELARSHSFEFSIYGKDTGSYDPATGVIDPDGGGPAAPFVVENPDFTYLSLRGSAVFRWEYLPGSALFLVWTQNREDANGNGTFDLAPSMKELGQIEPENIFLAKVTYYFTL